MPCLDGLKFLVRFDLISYKLYVYCIYIYITVYLVYTRIIVYIYIIYTYIIIYRYIHVCIFSRQKPLYSNNSQSAWVGNGSGFSRCSKVSRWETTGFGEIGWPGIGHTKPRRDSNSEGLPNTMPAEWS